MKESSSRSLKLRDLMHSLLMRLPLRPEDVELAMSACQIAIRQEENPQEFSIANIINQQGAAKLDVTWAGQVMQLDPTKAREIAWMLLEGASIGEAEAMMMRFLQGEMGVKPHQAAAVLMAFRRYREADPHSSLVAGTEGQEKLS